jgi:hypothetical protein
LTPVDFGGWFVARVNEMKAASGNGSRLFILTQKPAMRF